jgi:hypothetical protein
MARFFQLEGMEKVGTTGRRVCGGRGGTHAPGRGLALKIALHGSLATSALLLLLVTMFSTTERFPSKPSSTTESLAAPSIGMIPSSRVSRMMPGHSIVADSMVPVGKSSPVDISLESAGRANIQAPLSWPPAKSIRSGAGNAEGLFEHSMPQIDAGQGAKGVTKISMRTAEPVQPFAGRQEGKGGKPIKRSPVPLPVGLWLLAFGILGLLGLRKKYLP